MSNVPNGWVQGSISDLVGDLSSGVSVNSQDNPASPRDFGVLKTSCISFGKFNPNENKTIDNAEISRARINPIEGSIIVSRMNTPDLVGESGLVTKTEPNLFLPDRLWQTNFHSTVNIDPYWFASLIQEASIKRKIQDAATGTSNSMKNISKGSFLSIEIPIPPFEEQRKIGQILRLVDEQIELTEKLIEKKKVIKKGLLSDLLELFSCRSHGVINLYQLAYGVRGVSYDPNQLLAQNIKGSFTLLRSNNIKHNRINLDSIQIVPNKIVSEEQRARHFDIAVCMSNGSKRLVGKSARIGEIALHQNITVGAFCSLFRVKDPEDASFIRHLFQSSIYQKHIDIVLAGSAINNLQNSVIEELQIPNLMRKDRSELGEILDAADLELDSIYFEHKKLKLRKQGLVQDLLMGQVRVN